MYAPRQVAVEWVSLSKLATSVWMDANPYDVTGTKHSLRDGPATMTPPVAAGWDAGVVVDEVVDEVDEVVVEMGEVPPPSPVRDVVEVVGLGAVVVGAAVIGARCLAGREG